MPLILPAAPGKYDKANEQAARDRIVQEDALNLKKNTDVAFSQSYGPVLTSPDGTRWRLTISNTGAITATSL